MCRPTRQPVPGRADGAKAVALTFVVCRGATVRAAATFACAWLLCAPPAAWAQASAPPAPQAPIQMLDVPYIAQTEALCGGAAAAMVLRFWGERGLTAESFAHLMDDSASGIRTTTLIDDLRRRGWNANGVKGSEAMLQRELERGRPTMVLIEDRPGSFHYVVVVASMPTTVVVHDPARAPFRAMARDEFTRRWDAAKEERLAKVLSWQSEEGWFPEYEGFDPGYHTLTVSCLARLYELRPDDRVRDALIRAVRLAERMVHPDGSYGGEYASRNTYNFFPHGFELAGKWMPEAPRVNDRFLRGVANGLAPCYADDHLVGASAG